MRVNPIISVWAAIRDAFARSPMPVSEAKSLIQLDHVLAKIDAEIAHRKSKHKARKYLEPRRSARVHQILAGQA